jgi:hypothetical protein
LQLLSFVIRNVDRELFFERHHQFHRVKRVSSQVLDELCFRCDLLRVHTQLFDNDVADFVSNVVSHDSWGDCLAAEV